MQAIDTNVVARFLLDDDPDQSGTARRLIAQGVLIPVTVLLEAAWLLTSRYGFSRGDTASLLLELIDIPTVTTSDTDRVRWALARARSGGDLADLIHLAGSKGAAAFATFDRGVAPAAGPDSPLPVETLR